jgi:hydrogenase-4 component F
VVGALFLVFLSVIFVGMGATVLKVVQGDPAGASDVPRFRDTWLTAAPPFVLMVLVLVLGLYLPSGLRALFDAAAARVGG